MNTAKRERIIKNLYDLQCLDSWEDSEHFMEAVEAIRMFYGILWISIEDVQKSIKDRYLERFSYYEIDTIFDAIYDDERYIETTRYVETPELFADVTCSSMTFEKFRSLCLEYMDFSQLIFFYDKLAETI